MEKEHSVKRAAPISDLLWKEKMNGSATALTKHLVSSLLSKYRDARSLHKQCLAGRNHLRAGMKGDTSLARIVFGAIVFNFVSSSSAEEMSFLKAGVVKIRSDSNGLKKTGAGIVVSLSPKCAYILTANHVVKDDHSPRVAFFADPSKALKGDVMNVDGDLDLALLRVCDQPKLEHVLSIAADDKLDAGTGLMAIGFAPAIGDWMVTTPSVAGRTAKWLMLSGEIEEGYSGGPVIRNNEVVGIVSGQRSPFAFAAPASSARKKLIEWGILTGVSAVLTAHKDSVLSIAFSPDGKTLASGSKDKTVRLWDVTKREPLGPPLLGHQEAVLCVAFSPDGKTLASVSSNGIVIVWNLANGKPMGDPIRVHDEELIQATFSLDTRILAFVGQWSKEITLWDVKARVPLGQLPIGHATVNMTMGPNRTLAAIISNLPPNLAKPTMIMWDLLSREPLSGQFELDKSAHPHHIVFSPTGKALAVSDYNIQGVLLWDNVRRELRRLPIKNIRGVSKMIFSADAETMAFVDKKGTVTLSYYIMTANPSNELILGGGGKVLSVGFSFDGRLLATGGEDNNVILWQIPSRPSE